MQDDIIENLNQYDQRITAILDTKEEELKQLTRSVAIVGQMSLLASGETSTGDIEEFRRDFKDFVDDKIIIFQIMTQYVREEPQVIRTDSVPYNLSDKKSANPKIELLGKYQQLVNSIEEKMLQVENCLNTIQETKSKHQPAKDSSIAANSTPKSASDIGFFLSLQRDTESAEKGDIKAALRMGSLHQKFANKDQNFKDLSLEKACEYYLKALKSAKIQSDAQYIELAKNYLSNLGRDESGKLVAKDQQHSEILPKLP